MFLHASGKVPNPPKSIPHDRLQVTNEGNEEAGPCTFRAKSKILSTNSTFRNKRRQHSKNNRGYRVTNFANRRDISMHVAIAAEDLRPIDELACSVSTELLLL